MKDDVLRIYLNDHLAGSVGAIEVIEHCLANNAEGPLGTFLPRLLEEVKEDQEVLKDILERIGIENPVKQAMAWLAEKVHRVKYGGEGLGYSDLKRMEELEALVIGVHGKRALWKVLDSICSADPRLQDIDYAALAERAQKQQDELEPHRITAARRAFVSLSQELEGHP
jgi:hypothetical protein